MLEKIHSPGDVQALEEKELSALAEEIRKKLVETVLRQGGHLASNLGMVELTIALNRVFTPPRDKILFDVGHQAYVYKMLTGRQAAFESLREKNGLSGFSRRSESEYDAFSAGHAGTAISAALGMARARDLAGETWSTVAVVGDGAMTSGMCYEALNDAGHAEIPLIVVLNDNEMSISHNVGALSAHLTRLRQSFAYDRAKEALKSGLGRVPAVGEAAVRGLTRLRDSLKQLVIEDKFFDALGFQYLGPIDGHDIQELTRVLRKAREAGRPVLIHVVTQKGRGYEMAEARPDVYHGVPPEEDEDEAVGESFGRAAAAELMELARGDDRIVAFTAAMPQGTGLSAFAEAFPARFFDVGIAEEHMITTAAGMAAAGMRPYVAVYSTFLQRGYDQLIHDVCLENLPLTLLIDRSGLVGRDGATHQGVYDLSYLRQMPNMTVAAPRDIRDLCRLLRMSARMDGPLAIRYPKKGEDLGEHLGEKGDIQPGRWEELISGGDAVILAVGRMVGVALRASVLLAAQNISCGVIDARFIKPMDEDMLAGAAKKSALLVTLEDNALMGGFGSGVAEWLSDRGVNTPLLRLGVPDRFIEQGTLREQAGECGLTEEDVARAVGQRMKKV